MKIRKYAVKCFTIIFSLTVLSVVYNSFIPVIGDYLSLSQMDIHGNRLGIEVYNAVKTLYPLTYLFVIYIVCRKDIKKLIKYIKEKIHEEV